MFGLRVTLSVARTISVFRDTQLNSFYVYPSEWKGRLVMIGIFFYCGSSGHKKKRAREKETREGGACLPRAPVFSFAYYLQAPATQAKCILSSAMFCPQ